MIITNKYNLPQSFVEMAKEEHEVKEKEYRVTSLLKGVRETILFRRHHQDIEKDVSDMIWLLFGKAVHNILENQQETDTELKEERVKAKIGDYTISGQFDLYCEEEKKITDYKTASVWKIIYQDYKDWRKQLLIYAWIMRQYGFEVKEGEVVALLKDHQKSKAKYDSNYPQLPVYKKTFKFSEEDFLIIETWLYMTFNLIEESEKLQDNELPICTEAERFNSGGKYAVMKTGRKTALKVFDDAEEAEKWMSENNKGDYIEYRPGEDKKCQDYCDVNMFCSYYLEKEGRVS